VRGREESSSLKCRRVNVRASLKEEEGPSGPSIGAPRAGESERVRPRLRPVNGTAKTGMPRTKRRATTAGKPEYGRQRAQQARRFLPLERGNLLHCKVG